MWKQKLCLSANLSCDLSVAEQIRLFHKTGFEGFFTGWERGESVEEYAALAKELGMVYQSIHAPFGKSAVMWHGTDEEAEEAINELIECVNVCAQNGVEIMIAHTFIGFDDDRLPNKKGLERYGRVVAQAEKLGVKIAFENTRVKNILPRLWSILRKMNM